MHKIGGPRIRLTTRKKVSNQFEKFTFSIPAPTQMCGPIRGKTAQAQYRNPTQARDPIHGDPAQALHTRDPRVSPLKARNSTRGHLDQAHDPRVFPLQHVPLRGSTHQFGPNRPFQNWVWTRNPNLGISSPSEVRFRPFKRRYDQYSEEHYS